MFKRWCRNGPTAAYEPPRKQPKQQRGRGPWFHPPRRPSRAVYSNWGQCGEPWRPPPMAFQSPLCPAQMIRAYGLHLLCLCCCSCWSSPWNPGWERPPGRKKRWGRRGRGLRRCPRRSFQRSPPADPSKLPRPGNLCGWRAPGMMAPPNTTQFIMNQIYEDMREQEKLERQQAAMRAQQAREGDSCHGGSTPKDVSPCRVEDPQLLENPYGFMQDPNLAFSPAPVQQNQSPNPQQVEEEERNDGDEEEDQEVYDGKEESEEEEEDGETEGEEGDEDVEEADNRQEGQEDQEEEGMLEEEGLEEREQRLEEKFLPLGKSLSILIGEEEERENFINYDYLSSEHIIPTVPEEDLFMFLDINQ